MYGPPYFTTSNDTGNQDRLLNPSDAELRTATAFDPYLLFVIYTICFCFTFLATGISYCRVLLNYCSARDEAVLYKT